MELFIRKLYESLYFVKFDTVISGFFYVLFLKVDLADLWHFSKIISKKLYFAQVAACSMYHIISVRLHK